MWLLSAFGVVAVALACVGLYGAVSYSVIDRAQAIGIRLALGAQRGRSFAWCCVRACNGRPLASASDWPLRFSHFGRWRASCTASSPPMPRRSERSPPLFLMALLACYVPARRATRGSTHRDALAVVVALSPRQMCAVELGTPAAGRCADALLKVSASAELGILTPKRLLGTAEGLMQDVRLEADRRYR
jgi:hypothetical protein